MYLLVCWINISNIQEDLRISSAAVIFGCAQRAVISRHIRTVIVSRRVHLVFFSGCVWTLLFSWACLSPEVSGRCLFPDMSGRCESSSSFYVCTMSDAVWTFLPWWWTTGSFYLLLHLGLGVFAVYWVLSGFFLTSLIFALLISCQGRYHFLEARLCRWCIAPLPVHTGTHFADLRRMAGWVNPTDVLIQRLMGLELRTRGSQAATLTTDQHQATPLSDYGQVFWISNIEEEYVLCLNLLFGAS